MEGTSNRMDSQTNHDRPLRHKALARKKTHAAFMQLARTKPSSGLGRAKASQHRQRAPRIPLAETPQVESKKKNEPNPPKTTEANGCCIHGNPSSPYMPKLSRPEKLRARRREDGLQSDVGGQCPRVLHAQHDHQVPEHRDRDANADTSLTG